MVSKDEPGFDLSSMLRQAQKLTEDMASRQADLASRRYEGSAGGGAVKAAVVGGRLESITLDPSVTDDVELLSDLVMAAVNNALSAASADNDKTIGELTGGLDLGGLLG